MSQGQEIHSVQKWLVPSVQNRVRNLVEIIFDVGTANIFRELQTSKYAFEKCAIAPFLGVDIHECSISIANVDGRKG
jgi:hypothetical protein